ncbi:EF hand domain containing protein [Nitzschia inconspicua]|uniref:EF hand domain containing protein n=1 Tax=Nitzschia inconspicua TaxID=303405 RepID=A0A9K3LN24_9STRA|nr:EF hand domain containing protein [Nitzschia inconspicua]
MGFFGNKKKAEQPLRQPLYTSHQHQQQQQHISSKQTNGTSVQASRTNRSNSGPDLSLDWSKIYVEIDNDANAIDPLQQNSLDTGSYDETAAQSMTEFGSASTATTRLTPTFSNVQSASGELTGNHSTVIDMGRERVEGEEDEEVTHVSSSPTEEEDVQTRMTGRTLNAASSYQPTVRSNLTFKEDEDDDDTQANFTITNNGKYLTTNDFANGQLMRWKFAAEEGPTYIQFFAFFASLAGLASTLYPVVTDEAYWTIPIGICAFHTTIMCCIILIFEFRALGARNPMNIRARARTMLTRYLNILRLLWGRGCLYIFTGSLNLTISFMPYSLYTGLALIGLGLLAILVGAHASFNLERLKMSLTDHSFLWSKFEAADTNNDNLIDISEFSNLVWSLGLELDDAYTFRAFSQIDNDCDARINFREFKNWWIAVQDDIRVPAKAKKRLPKSIDV